jgi:hypothetical protein
MPKEKKITDKIVRRRLEIVWFKFLSHIGDKSTKEIIEILKPHGITEHQVRIYRDNGHVSMNVEEKFIELISILPKFDHAKCRQKQTWSVQPHCHQ